MDSSDRAFLDDSEEHNWEVDPERILTAEPNSFGTGCGTAGQKRLAAMVDSIEKRAKAQLARSGRSVPPDPDW